MEREGQLTLFAGTPPSAPVESPPGADDGFAQIVPFPHRLGPFDEALRFDETGNDRAEDAYLRAVESGDRPADAWCNPGRVTAIVEKYATTHDALLRYPWLILERDGTTDAVAEELLRHIRSAMNLS